MIGLVPQFATGLWSGEIINDDRGCEGRYFEFSWLGLVVGIQFGSAYTSAKKQAEWQAASADRSPEGQDAQQGLAGTESGAVPEGQTPSPSPVTSPAAGR